jgi:hypothetical protein
MDEEQACSCQLNDVTHPCTIAAAEATDDRMCDPYFSASALPSLGLLCPRCHMYAWARMHSVYLPGENITYLTSGQLVICTNCIPPRLWKAFFDKYDLVFQQRKVV